MQGCIFSKRIETFPELIFERKKLFHSFRRDLLVAFGKVFVILRWKLHKILRFWKLFKDQKRRILENVHP